MKILRDTTYKDLLAQIKQGEDSARDYAKRLKNKEYEIDMSTLKVSNLEIENKKLINSNVELLKQNDLLKAQKETIIASIEKISKKLHIANSRLGGLTKQNKKLIKQNNQLSDELSKTKCILESYKDCHDKVYPKKTINQYDKRLKVFRKRNK